MIFVDRYRKDESGRDIRPPESWFDDAVEATELAKNERSGHKWDRNVYADEARLKPALEKLFFDKCAYCETKFLAGADSDVEHFRPKGRVAERKKHPGYYWLGYKWENLYLSCPHCNQLRKDKPRWGDPRTLPSGGKLDQFPLLDGAEATRAMGPDDDIYEEATLLIDPCYDDPEWYMAYDPQGQVLALEDNPYGEKTIEVFHLKRRKLRDARKVIMDFTIHFLEKIKEAKSQGNEDAVGFLEELLEELLSASSEYAGVVRFVLNNSAVFLADNS
ncbi:MAG: hypothetical protein FVQ85_00015 [Planctomycetes bacterium]|nr:hypothetical protein [Planctomycetota bacterium]